MIHRFVYVSSDAVYWRGLGHRRVPAGRRGASVARRLGLRRAPRWAPSSCAAPSRRPTASPASSCDPPPRPTRRSSSTGRAPSPADGSSVPRWTGTPGVRRPAPTEQSVVDALARHDDGADRLFLLVAPDGTSSMTMLTAAEDAAAGLAAMIEPPEAVDEAFNIGPAEPHCRAGPRPAPRRSARPRGRRDPAPGHPAELVRDQREGDHTARVRPAHRRLRDGRRGRSPAVTAATMAPPAPADPVELLDACDDAVTRATDWLVRQHPARRRPGRPG